MSPGRARAAPAPGTLHADEFCVTLMAEDRPAVTPCHPPALACQREGEPQISSLPPEPGWQGMLAAVVAQVSGIQA